MIYNWFFGMRLGQLEAEVLRKLWVQFTEDSHGHPSNPDVDFARYSQYRIRLALNGVAARIAAHADLVRTFFVITLKQNYREYPVPANMLRIENVYYFTSATQYTELEVYAFEEVERIHPGFLTETGVPAIAYQGLWGGVYRRLGVAPAPSADGTAITLASGVTSGLAIAPFATAAGIDGSCGPGSTATKMVDSAGRNFSTLGIVVGMFIKNTTDGSFGEVTSIANENATNDALNMSGGLSGGLANTWTPGDAFFVSGGEKAQLVEIEEAQAHNILAADVGMLPQPGITMASGNLLVVGTSMPVVLQNVWQHPELHPIVLDAVVYGAASKLASECPPSSPEHQMAEKYNGLANNALAGISAYMRDSMIKPRLVGDRGPHGRKRHYY